MSVQSVVEWARQPNAPVRPSALALANGVRVVWTPYSGTVSQKAAYRFGRSGLGAGSATDNAFQVGKDAAVQKAAAAFAVVLIDVGAGYSGASATRLIGTRGTAEGDGNRRGWEISADGGTYQDWVLQAFNSGGRSPVVIWSSSAIPAAGDLQLAIIEVSRDASNTYGTIYSSINGGAFSSGSGTVTGLPFGDDTGSNYLEVGGKMAGTATTDTVSIVLAAWGVGATSAAFREALRRNPWRLARGRSIWVPVASVTSTTHTTTGALSAQAATVAGTAAHLTLHTSTGALAASTASVTGAATHLTLHTTTGALAADAAVVAGTAAHTTPGVHATTGALTAQEAVVAGTAIHLTLHTATGALEAGSATVAGLAQNGLVVAGPIVQGNLGWRVRKDKRDTDREELRQELMEALGEAIPTIAPARLLAPDKGLPRLPPEIPAALRAALLRVRRPHPEVSVQLKDLRAAVATAQEAAQARQVRRKRQQATLLLY